jgi:TrmH family RNA methyltransferase
MLTGGVGDGVGGSRDERDEALVAVNDGAAAVPRAPEIASAPPELREWRALQSREHRDRTGRYVVEGTRFVRAALRARTPIDAAIVCPDVLDEGARLAVATLRRRAVRVREVTRREFAEASNAEEPTGVAAIVHQRWTAPRRPSRGEAPVWLAIGSIRSRGNLGTILRTAFAAGAAGALFLDPATDPFDPGTVRASMGAVLGLPLARMTPSHLGAWKRRAGVLVVGTSSEAPRDFREVPRRRPTVVIVGCERRGMSRGQRRACDLMVSIPMAPGTDSLNVGVATGIVLFAVVHP